MSTLVSVFSQFVPMEWLTVGLVLFAGVTAFVAARAEEVRRRERKLDDERESDRAFQVVWLEHFRLNALSNIWGGNDLIGWSALGTLTPGQLLPRNWETTVTALNRLSLEAGYLGGVALTLAHDTETEIATLNAVVADWKRNCSDLTTGPLVELIRENATEVVKLESKIKNHVSELALLIWDAARHNPRIDLIRNFNFRDDMESELGKQAAIQAQKRFGRTPNPTFLERARALATRVLEVIHPPRS
jgi:hypothetical protein